MNHTISIVSVVESRVQLRKRGRKLWGLCPFHSEKSPSFAVTPERNLFYCFGCRVGGDVIRFIELIDRTDFKGAQKILGIDRGDYTPKHVDTHKQLAAARLAAWMNQQHLKVGATLRELSRNIAVAQQAKATALVERLEHEFYLLETYFDDLQLPEYAQEFLEAKAAMETITATAPHEPLPDFPALTSDYRRYLAEVVP